MNPFIDLGPIVWVFTLKILEYRWARKQFDFDEKDEEPFRFKIATKIFQNSKEVPYVNDRTFYVNDE